MKTKIVLVFVLVVLLSAGCSTPAPVTVVKTVMVEKLITPTSVPMPEVIKPPMEFATAMACVQAQAPASAYSTNDYLPVEPVLGPSSTSPLNPVKKIKVGMPWILNDEEAPLYNAIELGYYAEEGLEVELVPGGPGKDHLQTLGGGAVDIAIAAGGSTIPAASVSPTPIDLVAVGTLLKGMPYTFLTIDPQLQDRKLTPLDLVGTTLAVQPASEFYAYMMLDKYGIPRSEVTIDATAGFGPDVLLAGKADFYAGWIMNQPRLLEENSFTKWNSILYRDWVYDEYSDTIAVRRETLSTTEGQDLVRRFLQATYRGVQFLLENPEKSADIAVKYGVEAQLTKEQALWRFEHQKFLVVGNDALPLMYMDQAKWDQTVATLTQYELIAISCK